ncbi:MAG: hypothetical protein ACYTFY_14105 [Planctomycetota bacterium]|jgi:hypothetical protein
MLESAVGGVMISEIEVKRTIIYGLTSSCFWGNRIKDCPLRDVACLSMGCRRLIVGKLAEADVLDLYSKHENCRNAAGAAKLLSV